MGFLPFFCAFDRRKRFSTYPTGAHPTTREIKKRKHKRRISKGGVSVLEMVTKVQFSAISLTFILFFSCGKAFCRKTNNRSGSFRKSTNKEPKIHEGTLPLLLVKSTIDEMKNVVSCFCFSCGFILLM